jgi:hypothetical protein
VVGSLPTPSQTRPRVERTLALGEHGPGGAPVEVGSSMPITSVVLIERSIGTIIPGFVPEPWGKIPRHTPTWGELTVSAGLWALGAFIFTILAKAAIPIELRHAGRST